MLRNKVLDSLKLIVFLLAFYTFAQLYYTRNFSFKEDFELIIGEASNLPATWVGIKDVDKNIPILILAGHAELQESIVKIGKKKGLNIRYYDPEIRNIDDANDPKTNWSVGKRFAKSGGYAIEIHFDAYGMYGVGSGLIPPFSETPNKIDESIARKFGRFPVLFRGGLGAPRRQIRVLEIGKLEGLLEQNLRNLKTRQKTIKLLATEIVQAFLNGII